MSKIASLRNWGAVLLLLLIAGSAALWPTIRDELDSSSTTVEPEAQSVEINLPMTVFDTDTVSLSSAGAMGILLGIVAALVIGTGVALAFAYTMLAKQVAALSEDEGYQARLATLSKRDDERIKQLNEDRPAHPVPEHNMPRWSVLSTSLIILLFVVFFGMLINVTFVPEGQYEIGGRLVNSSLPVVGGFLVVAVALLIWRMRPRSLDGFEATDSASIPWDFIWVLVSGLLVVGLGIGALVYLNVSL